MSYPPRPRLSRGEWRSTGSMIWWETTVGPAHLVFSTRQGGVSAAPYDTLNLGLHVGDAPEAVGENRRRFQDAAMVGLIAPVVAGQVHGTQVAMVGRADAGRGWQARDTSVPDTDALVTRDVGLPLAILVADCAPVALLAPEGVLAVAHAGWRGLVGGVLEATLRQMEAVGGGPRETYQAVVGPCIGGCCYEVGEEVWRHFPGSSLAPAERPGAQRLDLAAAVVHALSEAGVPEPEIQPVGLCTACHPDLFFSHRRATQEGLPTTGRMALFGWLKG